MLFVSCLEHKKKIIKTLTLFIEFFRNLWLLMAKIRRILIFSQFSSFRLIQWYLENFLCLFFCCLAYACGVLFCYFAVVLLCNCENGAIQFLSERKILHWKIESAGSIYGFLQENDDKMLVCSLIRVGSRVDYISLTKVSAKI